MRCIILVLFLGAILSPLCHAAESLPRRADSTSTPVPGAPGADSLDTGSGMEGRLMVLTPFTGVDVDVNTPFAFGLFNIHFDKFVRPESWMGLNVELGIVALWNFADAVLPIPYASFGPTLRFGQFRVEASAGLLLIVPYLSSSAVLGIPLSSRLDLKLQATAMTPVIDPTLVLLAGAGLSLR